MVTYNYLRIGYGRLETAYDRVPRDDVIRNIEITKDMYEGAMAMLEVVVVLVKMSLHRGSVGPYLFTIVINLLIIFKRKCHSTYHCLYDIMLITEKRIKLQVNTLKDMGLKIRTKHSTWNSILVE